MIGPRLRFQVVTFDGEVLADAVVGFLRARAQARRDATLANTALAEGQAVALIVRDPDLDNKVIHAEARYPTDWEGQDG